MSVTRRKAEFMLLLVTVCWAVSFPAIKIAASYASASVFVGVRFTLSTLLLLIFWPIFAKGLPPELRRRGFGLIVEGPAVRWGLLMGVLITVGYTTQTIGLHTTTANNSAFITALSVVLVPVFLFVFRGIRPSRAVGAGILTAVAGLALLTRPDLGRLVVGDVWTIVCAVSYAIYLMLLNDALRRVSYLPLLFWTMAVCAVLNLVRMAVFEEIVLVVSRPFVWAVLVTTFFSTLAALYLQNRFQVYTTPTRAALIFSAEPVFAAVCSWIALNEILPPLSLLGAALIMSAVLLTELKGHAGQETDSGAES